MAINYSSKNKNSLKKCMLTNFAYVNWLLLNIYIILYEKPEIYQLLSQIYRKLLKYWLFVKKIYP